MGWDGAGSPGERGRPDRGRPFVARGLVELPDPGYQIVRDIRTLHEAVELGLAGESRGGHAEVRIRNLRVPHANVIGDVGGGFAMGQHRLGYGRLRHGMWSIAKAQRALDMAAQHALERETFGQPLADRQGVQWMLADCARDLYIARLMVLHIAYKMEHGLDIGQENSPRLGQRCRTIFGHVTG
jgi:acyl-CoA dehydrogenase